MDYSQLQNDPDHPNGDSPWVTSPQPASRASYEASTIQSGRSSPIATSTAFTRETSRISSDMESGQEEPKARKDGYTTPRTERSSTLASNGDSSPDLSTRLQSPSFAEESYGSQQYQQSPYEQQYATQQQRQPPVQGQQQQQKSMPSRYQHTNRTGPRPNAPQYKLQAKITGLERSGRKDPIMRFDVHTNLPRFRTTQFRDVRRTHAEFIKLADHLISSNPEAMVPAVPSALTSAGAGTDEDEARVKVSMQRWLNAVCGNDVLMRDDEMIFFVESDFGYSPVVRMKQPATGVRRKVLKQFAPPPDDTPELHEARPVVKLFYLGTMETGQKVDKVVKARRSLGLAESDLGVKIGALSVQEPHPGLASAYRKLGKTIQTTGDFHAAQGTAEAVTIGDPLNYHSSDAFIVKETLTNRHILLRELVQAQTATRSRLAAADRLKASSSVRREKVDEAISALDEARSHEMYLGQKCARVTTNLLQEKRRWFARTSADLRTAIREYVLREIEAERRTLATLENVRPDIRSIDASGGLSRLGREGQLIARRASMAASQGPKGDAWSGVQRKEGVNRAVSGFGAAPQEDQEGEAGKGAEVDAKGRKRAVSGVSAKDEDDDDRIDAKNAASRLAASTF
ncbi:Vacuolar protein sorting-associated protein 17 [Agyrium rufum]|nr:Vacuolar protein sorting-associated protein 17 [Agyrium rufum]